LSSKLFVDQTGPVSISGSVYKVLSALFEDGNADISSLAGPLKVNVFPEKAF
jgi:hypothetical protein